MPVDTTDYRPVDLLGCAHARDYLLDNLYLETVCAWILDHPQEAEYAQEKLRCNIEALSIEGLDIVWQRLGTLPGWKELVWEGLGKRAYPVYDCNHLLRKTTGVIAVQEMYLFLYDKLRRRGSTAALKFSQEAAISAASWAISGIWQGAHLLMEAIIDKESSRYFLVGGQYSWWAAAAKTLDLTMDKGGTLMSSGILDLPTLKYIELLENADISAENDPPEVGKVFVRACQFSEGYIPLLWAWVSSGGKWRDAWQGCGEEGQKLMERHPCVLRSKLMDIAKVPIVKAGEGYTREM